MSPYCIVLADDHNLLRRGINKIIETSEDMLVVAEAGDGIELLEVLNKIIPHLVILDISMPRMGGVEATRKIKAAFPEVKILILSMHKDKEYLYHAFSAGAEGYLLKEDTDTELFPAIESIRKGGIYLSPYFSKALVRDFLNRNSER